MPFSLARRSPGFLSLGKAKLDTAKLVNAVEVGATAFGLGMLQGYRTQTKGAAEAMPAFSGVPLDLGLAVALHLVGSSGYAGKFSSHAHAVADGALAYYAAHRGQVMGVEMGSKAASGSGSGGSSVGASGNELQEAYIRALREANPHLTNAQIASLAQAR